MSVINGIWHKDGRPLDREYLLEQAAFSERYAPDGTVVRHGDACGMSFQGLHTHERSSFDAGPSEDSFGNMAVLDGRIDNGEQLCQELGLIYQETGDTALVLAGFRKWGEDCFNRIVGDWAVAIWSRKDRSLYLARDHAGTRTLYYSDNQDSTAWSTYPEPLIPLQSTIELCEGYAVRYLACLPLNDLTPYDHIRTVKPAHYLHFSKAGPVRSIRYWRPALREHDEHRSDVSYQEEFLYLFRQAVKRRVEQSNNLICHLSGGMDSSAIVCVADLLAKEGELSDHVRTLSFYDATEPHWDDHLYFTVVESQRGQVGAHFSGSLSRRSFESSPAFYPLPGADGNTMHRESELEDSIGPGTVRTIVAGHGGDELLGGRSDPIPELADHLYGYQWRMFVSGAFEWARALGRPLVTITREATTFIWNQYPRPKAVPRSLPPWMHPLTIEPVETGGLRLWQSRTLGYFPSELDKQDTWENLTDTLPHLFHANGVRYEYRYPFLDKNLVEFLLRVPYSQLSRPKRRRYMMRRALRGIVPQEVLERRRKAYVNRGPLQVLINSRNTIANLIPTGLLTSKGLIHHSLYLQALDSVVHDEGSPQWLLALMRAIELELWMSQAVSPNAFTETLLGNKDLHAPC